MSSVEKITVALSPEMTAFIRQSVETGEYASTSEAVREAVREWKERRDLLGHTVEELRSLVDEGLESGDSEHSSLADLKAAARRHLDLAKSSSSDLRVFDALSHQT